MEYYIYKSNELTHWGIKGMRWGIRRYQNKDGSLTPAGKKRLKTESDAIKKEEEVLKNRKATKAKFDRLDAKRKALEEQKKALDGKTDDSKNNDIDEAKTAKKSVKDMSDTELARAVNRARMEDEYNRLRPEPQPPEKHAMAKQMLEDVVKPAAINAGKKLVQDAMNKAVEKITGDKVDPDSTEALKKTFEKLDYKQKIDKLRNPDKYLSEEDRTKRQDREYKAEDRAAQKEGYANAADKAVKTREAAETARKAAADEVARASNESKSKEYYDALYRNKGTGEKTQTGKSISRELTTYDVPVTSLSKSTVSNGKSTVDRYSNYGYTELLDSGGNVILSWGDD